MVFKSFQHIIESMFVKKEECNTCIYIPEIGDVLYNMMTSYNDTDVQDKARFYYALMTSASDKKVNICYK